MAVPSNLPMLGKDAPEFVRVVMRWSKYAAHVAYAAGVMLRIAEVVVGGLREACDTVVKQFGGVNAPQEDQSP